MSASGQPISKRRRTDDDSEDSATLVPPVRSDIWYDDGNVILQAGGSQFKVHKSILAQSSSVFKDMFGFPQPPVEDTELVDGCPVVQLSDSAEELTIVLEAIFQRQYVTCGEHLTLSVVSTFLALGRKYDIPRLRAEGQKKMYQEFPMAFKDMDSQPEWKFIDVDITKHSRFMHLAALARKEGLISVLPHILYECCIMYSTAELLLGIHSPNHATIILAPEDQLACLAAHPAIVEAQAKTTFRWLYVAEELISRCCPRDSNCHQARQNVLLSQFNPLPDLLGLGPWDASYSEGMCLFCRPAARDKHNKGREQFWALLPSLFDLPAWSDLEKEREAVA